MGIRQSAVRGSRNEGETVAAVTRLIVGLGAAAVLIAGCGGPPGPDVRGMNLADAEKALDGAGVSYSEHATDALLGIIVKSNFVVCSEDKVNDHMVRLEVAKRGCTS
jgi:hypothetical protein